VFEIILHFLHTVFSNKCSNFYSEIVRNLFQKVREILPKKVYNYENKFNEENAICFKNLSILKAFLSIGYGSIDPFYNFKDFFVEEIQGPRF
jgi:hypothetical protein